MLGRLLLTCLIISVHSCLQAGPDADLSCPVCTQKPETLHLQTALQSQAESHDQHDQFHNLLNRSEEPFSLVSEYFGRGLFNQLVIVDENESVDVCILIWQAILYY